MHELRRLWTHECLFETVLAVNRQVVCWARRDTSRNENTWHPGAETERSPKVELVLSLWKVTLQCCPTLLTQLNIVRMAVLKKPTRTHTDTHTSCFSSAVSVRILAEMFYKVIRKQKDFNSLVTFISPLVSFTKFSYQWDLFQFAITNRNWQWAMLMLNNVNAIVYISFWSINLTVKMFNLKNC